MGVFPSLDDPLEVLVVEDEDDYAELVSQWLADNPVYATRIRRVQRLAAALEALADPTDVVLLDLTLPDEEGVRTVRRVVDETDAAVVVLTGRKDDRVAIETIRFGVQEFLVKDSATSEMVVRAVRYAAERQRLLRELDAARANEARERELRELERVSREASSSVAAASYGSVSVATSLGDRYDELAADYGGALERMMQARAYQTGYRPEQDLRALGDVLGFLRARPRDVVDLHRKVLRERIATMAAPKALALVEEGRLAVLELMGHLAAYYRTRSVGGSGQAGRGGS